MAAALIALAGSAFGANKYWVGASGTTNAPTSGTWQTTTPTVWSDGTADTANSGWVAADTAFFGGADGTYGIRVPAALSYTSMRFSASGYTLTNSAPTTITGPSAGTSFLTVDSGKTAKIGTNITVSFAGTSRINPSATASGTLIIENGGIVQQTVNSPLVIQGSNSVVNVKTGGIFRNAYTGSGSPYLSVGFVDGDDATLIVDGGTVTLGRTTASFWIPGSTTATAANMKGTVTVNGGTLKNNNAGSTAVFILGQGAGNVGTLNLNGGTVTINGVQGSATAGAPGAGTSVLTLNGGILKAVNANVNFVGGLTAAYVRNGGAVLDNSSVAVTIAQNLLHTPNALDNPTDGGLLSSGAGTLTLLGTNTYNGPTVVSAGKLVTTTASIGSGAYSVANGATLEVQVNTAGTSLTNSSLTLGTSAATTLNFVLGANASETIPAIQDNGALTLNGTVTVNVTGSFSTSGSTNLLISYASGGAGSFSFALGSAPAATGGAVRSLVNEGNQLKLIYAVPAQLPEPVKWAVGNGNWDTSTLNWFLIGGSDPTNYVETSSVTFDDTASGSSPITVTLTGDRSPAAITNNSTKNYILTGSSAINGTGAIVKAGSGTLTLAVASTHSGGATIQAGTLQVGSGGTVGSLGTAGVTNYGALAFNRSDSLTVSNLISGSGSVSNNGGGSVSLTAANTYSGTTVVNAGKLATTTASTGAGSFTVADGATLEVQAASASGTLAVSGLTLGTSGNLTNNFALGSSRSQNTAVVTASGALTLNGTAVVNVTGSGLSSGTYVLLQYASLAGSGGFVAGTMPSGVWSVVHDTVNKQLKMVGYAGFVWDSGNIGNESTIDAASGTWDLTAGNTVWNNAGVNAPYANGNSAVFAGADGAYYIKLGASVTPPAIAFVTSGYTLTNDTPQSVTLANVSTTSAKMIVAAGKTVTIGTNVTISSPNTTYVGNTGNTPGGTVVVENGGVLVQTTANTYALDGAGTAASIKTGGILRLQAGSTSGQIAIGVNNTGNAPTLSVDGGLVEIIGNGGALNIGNGSGSVAGILSLNGGSVTMPVTTTKALTLGVNAGNAGTLNLNGGTLNVAQVAKGNASAFATNNFNGGTLKAVNASFGSSFMTGLSRANVRDGGAAIDNGGFAITIGQALVHSDVSGDDAVDGGLTSLGGGTLTLNGANTYTGDTTISNGTLALGVGGSIGSSPNINVGAGAVFNVTAVAPWTLGATQTLRGNGTVSGTVNVSGTIAAGSSIGTLTFAAAPSLSGIIVAELNRTNAPTADKVVFNGGATFDGILTVANVGPALVNGDTFDLFDGSLAGSFATLNLPGGSAHWNTSDLNGNGAITFTNASPVASDITMGLALGETATLLVIGGKNAPTDADGDSMTITAVSAASSGTSSFDATHVTYTANGALGTNTFTYTVTDALGATDTKTVTVIVYGPEGFNRLSPPSVIGPGTVALSYLGIPGQNYALDWATNLTAPINWMAVITNTAAGNGVLNYTNTSAEPQNFFRTRHVP